MTAMVSLDAYPQLAFIAWNRAVRSVTEEEAFALYEANGRWLDRESMTDAERAFLDELIERHGKGVWLG